jgi:hypothetical protein
VDTECGPCGYCSPSVAAGDCQCLSAAMCALGPPGLLGTCYVNSTQVPCDERCGDSCGHGYFCHTPQDTCIDDSDCGNGGDDEFLPTCNYDVPSATWTCNLCQPPG